LSKELHGDKFVGYLKNRSSNQALLDLDLIDFIENHSILSEVPPVIENTEFEAKESYYGLNFSTHKNIDYFQRGHILNEV